MLIRVDTASERPIYAQIADAVRADIAQERLRAGDALPPAREVAVGLGINVHTVLRAYQDLRDEGLVDLRRRRGAVVTSAAEGIAELRGAAQSLVDSAAAHGIATETLVALIESTVPSSTAPAPPRPAAKGHAA